MKRLFFGILTFHMIHQIAFNRGISTRLIFLLMPLLRKGRFCCLCPFKKRKTRRMDWSRV